MIRAMAASSSSDVFSAIADPNRRRLLDMLARSELPAQKLADPFKISFGAISQHLRILREAGLVASRTAGRQRIYRITPKPLRAVEDWPAKYRKFWQNRLDRLGEYLDAKK